MSKLYFTWKKLLLKKKITASLPCRYWILWKTFGDSAFVIRSKASTLQQQQTCHCVGISVVSMASLQKEFRCSKDKCYPNSKYLNLFSQIMLPYYNGNTVLLLHRICLVSQCPGTDPKGFPSFVHRTSLGTPDHTWPPAFLLFQICFSITEPPVRPALGPGEADLLTSFIPTHPHCHHCWLLYPPLHPHAKASCRERSA